MSDTPAANTPPEPPADGGTTAPVGGVEAAALREAEALRATAARVAEATAEVRDRFHETERLLARAEQAHSENERHLHEAEAALSETHEGIREAHVHSDHGNRLLGSKAPTDTFSDRATPSGDPAAPSPHPDGEDQDG